MVRPARTSARALPAISTATRSPAKIATGPGGLTKIGQGLLTLNALNTYTGDTTVNDGTLAMTVAYLDDGSEVFINGPGVAWAI